MMREQRFLWSLLALNILFAAICATVLSRSKAEEKLTASTALTATAPAQTAPVAFNWANVNAPEYAAYLARLRAAGCPEEHVRKVVLADIEERCAQKRIEEAIAFDFQWWRDNPMEIPLAYWQERASALRDDRRALIEKHLGRDFFQSLPEPTPILGDIHLTGAILGSLTSEAQQKVQSICDRSLDQMDSAIWSQVKRGENVNNVSLAQIREQARVELRLILTPAQMEEFLLRYSRNAEELRTELRALEPTADEFRQIFRTIDPLAQSMQLQYGDLEALGSKEQGRYLRERESAIRAGLSPTRFQAYQLSKRRPATSQDIRAEKSR